MFQRLLAWVEAMARAPLALDRLHAVVGGVVNDATRLSIRVRELEQQRIAQAEAPLRTVVQLRGFLRFQEGSEESWQPFTVAEVFWLKRGERQRRTLRIESEIHSPELAVTQGPGLIAQVAIRGNVYASTTNRSLDAGVVSCELGDGPLDPAHSIDVDVVSTLPPEGA
jgi:hypothetical protein